jgi:hypothetical protein
MTLPVTRRLNGARRPYEPGIRTMGRTITAARSLDAPSFRFCSTRASLSAHAVDAVLTLSQ